jgi:hypothetical protein
VLLIGLAGFEVLQAAVVVIDGSFEDWEGINAIYANPDLPPGTTLGAAGVSYIKTYQEGPYVYFCYATMNPSGGSGIIAFDLDHNSDLRDTYATMSAEAAWTLGDALLSGTAVLDGPPTAARGSPDASNPGYELFEWCFLRDQQLEDGTPLFSNPGDEVWFTVGRAGTALASSQVTTFTLDLIPVPEPSGILLLASALLVAFRREWGKRDQAGAQSSASQS